MSERRWVPRVIIGGLTIATVGLTLRQLNWEWIEEEVKRLAGKPYSRTKIEELKGAITKKTGKPFDDDPPPSGGTGDGGSHLKSVGGDTSDSAHFAPLGIEWEWWVGGAAAALVVGLLVSMFLKRSNSSAEPAFAY